MDTKVSVEKDVSLDATGPSAGRSYAERLSYEIVTSEKLAANPQLARKFAMEMLQVQEGLVVSPDNAAAAEQAELREVSPDMEEQIAWTLSRLSKDSFVVAARDDKGALIGASRVHCDMHAVVEEGRKPLVDGSFIEKLTDQKVGNIYDASVIPDTKDIAAVRFKMVTQAMAELDKRNVGLVVADIECRTDAGDLVANPADRELFVSAGFKDTGRLTVVSTSDPLIIAAHYMSMPKGSELRKNADGSFSVY